MMTSNKRSKPPSKYKVKPPKSFKATLNLNLNHIVCELEVAKSNNGGKIPYGAITSIVRKMKPALPWLTKDMIQHRLRKVKGSMTGLLDLHDDAYLANSGQLRSADGTLSATVTPESTDYTIEERQHLTTSHTTQPVARLFRHCTAAVPPPPGARKRSKQQQSCARGGRRQ
jgi:hypothetical protein